MMAFDLSKSIDADVQFNAMGGSSTYTVAATVFTCQDCGHELYPGESYKKCSVCGSTRIEAVRDRSKRIEIQCAA